MTRPAAFLFDVFGTVVDWRTGVANYAKPIFDAKQIAFDPYHFADLWRGEYQPSMEKIRAGNRGYVPLDRLHLENLETVLQQTSLINHFDEQERAELNRAWEHLPPWPDAVSGLQAIRQKAIIAPCSNGSIALMTRIARYGGLPWDCILGAEIAQNYKPHPETYLRSVSALGLVPEQVVMVAAHNDDLRAARTCGLQTAFIVRNTEYGTDQASDLKPEDDWDYIVEKIGEIATLI